MAKKSSSKSYRRDDRYSEENTSRRASIATKINKQICGNMCCPKCGKQMVLEKKSIIIQLIYCWSAAIVMFVQK